MITSDKVDKILPALKAVKAELGAVLKSSNNPFFKSKYADLNTYLDEVEPRLEKEGLVLIQPVVTNEQSTGNTVVTRIYHVDSGQYVESSMRLVGESDMQKAGSGVTYARRYTLGALLSMKAEDDDGNTASGKDTKKSEKTSAVSTWNVQATNATTKAVPSTNTATKLEAKPEPKAERPSFRKKNAEAKAAAAPSQEPAGGNGDDI